MNAQDAKILIIEDNWNNLKLYQSLLIEEIGVEHYYAYTSGALAFEWLDSNRSFIPDIILLDIQLPQEDGYSVLQKIRARPELHNTKVVAVTSSVMKADMDKIRRAGFDGFIAKPIRVAAFEDHLCQVLDGGEVWDVR
jgi:two-component system, cell cycle response regulator DivK